MINFPSVVLGDPPSPSTDSGPSVALAMRFEMSAAESLSGARWYCMSPGVGQTVNARLVTTTTASGDWVIDQTLAVSSNITTVLGWNFIPFPAEVLASVGVHYAVIVFQPSSTVYTFKTAAFPQVVYPFTQTGTNCGGYSYTSPFTGYTSSTGWYGLDIVAQSLGGTSDVDVIDSVVAQRGGIPSTVTLSGSSSDPLGATAVGSKVVPVDQTIKPLDKVVHYLQRNRPNFHSLVDNARNGPGGLWTGSNEVGNRFTVQRECTLTGARIYKNPIATGTVPVSVWKYQTGELLNQTDLTWVADDGGWREFDLSSPVSLVQGTEYAVSYFSNAFVETAWRFNAQDYLEWPFSLYAGVVGKDGGGFNAAGCFLTGSHGYPSQQNSASWYWVDPRVEYDSPVKVYQGGREYFDQFSGWHMTDFPISVFAVDTGFFSEYQSIGINLPLPWDAVGARDEIVGLNMKFIGGASTYAIKRITLDPQLNALCQAWNYWDEPDMQGSGGTAEMLRDYFTTCRLLDSTRPMWFGFGKWMAQGQAWAWYPNAATVQYVTAMWRTQAELTDMLSLDDYSISNGSGIWNYAVQVERLKDFTDGRVPIFVTVETCVQPGGFVQPTVEESKRAAMLGIIHGAKMINWFDHQFATNMPDGTFYPQDFQAMLHDPVKKAGFTAFHTFLQTIKDALWAPDAGWLQSVVSSNTIAGPIGGELGVPIHTTTRQGAAGKRYLFAQAARPGTTTGTFTMPVAASKNLVVLNESRTVSVNGSGVFTDSFNSDYVYHIYEWS